MSEDKVVDVAVGVLIREDGRVLLASRPEGKPWAGYWEFPGGKLEDGETVHQALVRELDEELGVRLADSFPWFVKEHRYEHAHVRLHFRRSRDFFGEALSKEGQDFGFLCGQRAHTGRSSSDRPEHSQPSRSSRCLGGQHGRADAFRKRASRHCGSRPQVSLRRSPLRQS